MWQENRLSLTREIIDLGFRALIKCVDKSKVSPELLGLPLTHALMDIIIAGGADGCGENGEYHTFVCDGPIFSFSLPVELGKVLDFDSHEALISG